MAGPLLSTHPSSSNHTKMASGRWINNGCSGGAIHVFTQSIQESYTSPHVGVQVSKSPLTMKATL